MLLERDSSLSICLSGQIAGGADTSIRDNEGRTARPQAEAFANYFDSENAITFLKGK
jgi:hypothetical protein